MRLRSALLLALAAWQATALAAAPGWRPADGERLHFQLTDKKDRPVGRVVYTFTRPEDGVLTVERHEQMTVRKFLIKADIDQQLTEHWMNDRLHTVDALTRADTSLMDKTVRLRVARDAQGTLTATANDNDHTLPADAWPLTLWHSGFVDRTRFFATGGGELVQATTHKGTLDTVPADGGKLACQAHSLEAQVDGRSMTMQLWYDATGRLCRLQSDTGFGSITYTRMPTEAAQ